MSETHEPEPQPEEPPGDRPAQAGWTPPPPPPDWASPYGNGHGWQGPPAWTPPPRSEAGPPPAGPGWQPPPRPQAFGAPGGDRQGWNAPPPPPPWGRPPGGPGQGGGWSYGWAPAGPRRSLPSIVTALLLVVAVLVGLGIGHGVWRSPHNAVAGGTGSGSSQTPGNGGATSPFGNGSGLASPGPSSGLNRAAAAVSNDLVDIDTSLPYQDGAAAGTGIVLSADGYVLTNNHVISGATVIKARDIGNGQTYTATVVGYDRVHDIAVIKLDGASGLQTAKLGDSSKLAVGDGVVGIGNAGGVGGPPSIATGQVTALNQTITAQDESNHTSEQLKGLIQTDADIQPGDSGGALIDRNGNVVGMDTAASTGFSFQSPGNEGFAIPINEASSIAATIRSGRTTSTVHIGKTAFLGVEVDTSDAAAANDGATISEQGQSIVPNSPAAQAGLAPGDVITSLGGSQVTSASSLTDAIFRYHPGDKVTVGWTDTAGQAHQATVTLANGPAQ